jgi:transcriptional regulator with XRE-family HTH domain
MLKINQEEPGFYQIVGSLIRSKRIEKEMTLDQLNKNSGLGLTRSALSNMELGKQQMTTYQLFVLSKFLGISINKLFNDINKKLIKKNTLKILDGNNQINIEDL